MKLTEVLGRSFKALGSGTLWAFGVTALLVVAAPFVLVWAGISAAGVSDRLVGLIGDIGPSEADLVGGLVELYATLLVGGLLSILPLLVTRGGLIHAADAALARRPFSVGECWGFGLRHVGRTLGIEFVLGAIYLVAVLVAEIPFFALFLLGASASEDNFAGMLGGICFGYLYLLVAIMVIVIIYVGVEGLAIRYGLIGGRTMGDAIASGWKAFRVAWKKVVVFGLIMVVLAYAWQTVTSLVTLPLMFLTMPFSEFMSDNPDPAALGSFFDSFMWVYAAMLLLYTPMLLFNAVAWTSFFRQLTGLDAPAPTPYVPVDPQGYPVAPPLPPTPPAPPAEPPAPTPGEQQPDA